MTVLSVCQNAYRRLFGTRPSSFFSTTDDTLLQFAEIANESARDIMKAAEWQALTGLCTFGCDGTTVAFDLPSDFDRLQKDVRVHLASLITPLLQYTTADAFLYDQLRLGVSAVGRWIMLGGQMNVYPAQKAGDSIEFYYQKNTIVRTGGTTPATEFTTDADTFVLPERLLQLCIIWKYREHKGLPYDEAMQDYETELATCRMSDRGVQAIRLGQVRGTMVGGGKLAWPGVIGT